MWNFRAWYFEVGAFFLLLMTCIVSLVDAEKSSATACNRLTFDDEIAIAGQTVTPTVNLDMIYGLFEGSSDVPEGAALYQLCVAALAGLLLHEIQRNAFNNAQFIEMISQLSSLVIRFITVDHVSFHGRARVSGSANLNAEIDIITDICTPEDPEDVVWHEFWHIWQYYLNKGAVRNHASPYNSDHEWRTFWRVHNHVAHAERYFKSLFIKQETGGILSAAEQQQWRYLEQHLAHMPGLELAIVLHKAEINPRTAMPFKEGDLLELPDSLLVGTISGISPTADHDEYNDYHIEISSGTQAFLYHLSRLQRMILPGYGQPGSSIHYYEEDAFRRMGSFIPPKIYDYIYKILAKYHQWRAYQHVGPHFFCSDSRELAALHALECEEDGVFEQCPNF